MLTVGIPKEPAAEARVAATPETVARLTEAGLRVHVESGAGARAHFADAQYQAAGAQLSPDAAALWAEADLVLKVAPPGTDEVERLKPGAVLVGFLAPQRHPDLVRRLAERQVAALALELVPRISRAQRMDALSSQASIAGYKAVLLAAHHFGRYFPLLMTAAGTIPPARVLVLGAGVAGLQALATARRLGAVVQAADVRPAVREEVESLGGTFLELPGAGSGSGAGAYAAESGPELLQRQQALLHEHVARVDVVIGTAFVPGKPSPHLVTEAAVQAMKPGSILVDLAVEQGGNCVLSQCGQCVVRHGVRIFGEPNLPAAMPTDASILYARNVLELVRHLLKDGRLCLDEKDEITRSMLVTQRGQVCPPFAAT